MDDPRMKIAEEFCTRVFDALFFRPRDWTDQQATAHIEATTEAVHGALPLSGSTAKAVVDRAVVRLKAGARVNSWPTTRDVVAAVLDARSVVTYAAAFRALGWPHQNSRQIIEAAKRWIREHGTWPDWMQMEWSDEVGRELIEHHGFTEVELLEVGWRPKMRSA